MAVTVADAKLYLRVDGEDEDELIQKLLDVADSYLTNAITDYSALYESNEKFAAQADLLKMVLVNENYSNRDGRNDSRHDFSFVIRSMINQLQYFTAGDSS